MGTLRCLLCQWLLVTAAVGLSLTSSANVPTAMPSLPAEPLSAVAVPEDTEFAAALEALKTVQGDISPPVDSSICKDWLFYLGTQKGGTTSLFRYIDLGAHRGMITTELKVRSCSAFPPVPLNAFTAPAASHRNTPHCCLPPPTNAQSMNF